MNKSLIFSYVVSGIAIIVAVFGFIGAPTIYQILKSQNLIKYKPKSTKDNNTIIISKTDTIINTVSICIPPSYYLFYHIIICISTRNYLLLV